MLQKLFSFLYFNCINKNSIEEFESFKKNNHIKNSLFELNWFYYIENNKYIIYPVITITNSTIIKYRTQKLTTFCWTEKIFFNWQVQIIMHRLLSTSFFLFFCSTFRSFQSQ